MIELASQASSKRRWLTKRTAIKVSLLLAVSVLLYIGFRLDYHFVVIGYCKGQPRYRGLPVDYWRARVQNYQRWLFNPPPDASDGLLDQLYYLTGVSLFPKPPLQGGHKESVTVLLDLIKDSDPLVRSFAAQYLQSIQPPSQEAIDALIAGLDDPDSGVRYHSMDSLGMYGPAARKALPRIIQEFEEWKRRHPPPGPELAISPGDGPLLAKRYQQEMEFSDAARALQSIDREEARKRGLTLPAFR